MTVPGDDSLRSFGAKLANLLGAGRLDRKAAQCMHQHASTTLAGIAGSLEKAKGAAKAAFDEYHDYKDRIYREKVVGFTGVYKLLALSRSTHYVPAESEALKLPLTPDVPAVRALPSSAGKVILALCLGGVLGGAVGYGLEATGIVVGLNALAVIAIPAALAAIASAMVGGVSAAAKQREQQVEALTKKGDTTLAAQKQDEINRIKDARGRAVKSEVSTSDAMEARKSPTLSVGKDVLRVAHKAGTEAGKNAAILGGGISTLRNGYAVLNGDKTIGDASLDVLADTGRAAIAAYASGVTTATVGGALQAANEQVLRNLGKGNTPAMIVQTSTFLAKGMVDVIRGKITPEQLVGQLTREGTTLAMSLTGSNLGAVIGTFIAPGVGTIVGGFVGGMVSSMLSGSMHSMLQQSVRALELSDEQRERTQAICARLVWQHQEYRRQMSVVFEQFFLEKRTELKSAFDSISEATMRGDSIRQGLEGVAQAFGKRLAFDSGAHIRSRLRSGQALDF
ncbi:hypothetical protein WK07_25215 [Burkholderia multivorans]|nr:hypothetical protein WK07_25215 [Burkholderia multivorans]